MRRGRVGAYEVRTEPVKGGVVVWVLCMRTGACLWYLPLRLPLSAQGRAELRGCGSHVPGLSGSALEGEVRRQAGTGSNPK